MYQTGNQAGWVKVQWNQCSQIIVGQTRLVSFIHYYSTCTGTMYIHVSRDIGSSPSPWPLPLTIQGRLGGCGVLFEPVVHVLAQTHVLKHPLQLAGVLKPTGLLHKIHKRAIWSDNFVLFVLLLFSDVFYYCPSQIIRELGKARKI